MDVNRKLMVGREKFVRLGESGDGATTSSEVLGV